MGGFYTAHNLFWRPAHMERLMLAEDDRCWGSSGALDNKKTLAGYQSCQIVLQIISDQKKIQFGFRNWHIVKETPNISGKVQENQDGYFCLWKPAPAGNGNNSFLGKLIWFVETLLVWCVSALDIELFCSCLLGIRRKLRVGPVGLLQLVKLVSKLGTCCLLLPSSMGSGV